MIPFTVASLILGSLFGSMVMFMIIFLILWGKKI